MPEDLRSSAPGDFSSLRLVSAVLNFNTAGGTVTLDDLAVGDVVVQAWCEVVTAFNAGTTNVIALGTAGSAQAFLGTSDVTEGTPGVYPTGGKGPYTAVTSATTLVAAYSQTGTAATTGTSRVYALVASAPA